MTGSTADRIGSDWEGEMKKKRETEREWVEKKKKRESERERSKNEDGCPGRA
jgi:hypothetical protein